MIDQKIFILGTVSHCNDSTIHDGYLCCKGFSALFATLQDKWSILISIWLSVAGGRRPPDAEGQPRPSPIQGEPCSIVVSSNQPCNAFYVVVLE